jgi:phosphoribosylglycinamide formyltransferase-1
MAKTRIGVLASGRGSNFQAIIDSVESGFIKNAEIVVLISDVADAYAIERAKSHRIEALFINPKDFKSRGEFDMRIVDELKKRRVDLVLLAGYMRIITPAFVRAFKNRMMNIHPALLPSFPGLHAQLQALDYGVKVTGCTVHFVDEEVDHGPIIIQRAVEVKDDDTEETLSERIIAQEHKIYPLAVKLYAEGKISIVGRKVRVIE